MFYSTEIVRKAGAAPVHWSAGLLRHSKGDTLLSIADEVIEQLVEHL